MTDITPERRAAAQAVEDAANALARAMTAAADVGLESRIEFITSHEVGRALPRYHAEAECIIPPVVVRP